jgi:hypothetical protein
MQQMMTSKRMQERTGRPAGKPLMTSTAQHSPEKHAMVGCSLGLTAGFWNFAEVTLPEAVNRSAPCLLAAIIQPQRLERHGMPRAQRGDGKADRRKLSFIERILLLFFAAGNIHYSHIYMSIFYRCITIDYETCCQTAGQVFNDSLNLLPACHTRSLRCMQTPPIHTTFAQHYLWGARKLRLRTWFIACA